MKLPSFDYANTLESAVKTEGLRAGGLDEAAAAAVAAFRQRVDSGEIGFPRLPDDHGVARAVTEFADDLRGAVDDVLVLGIGGSALGSYALDVALRGPHPLQAPVGGRPRSRKRGAGGSASRGGRNAGGDPRPRLVVLDNIDPGLAAAALEQ
ncbi:MAG: hypothetical protein L0212_00265, partial [Acidobacteria bacterium]|nr:hypothetical protein [Acidobacteriota bacterium]